MPTGKFGANAAWWRLNFIVYDLPRLLEVEALPSQLQAARPKALRFHFFDIAGEVMKAGGQLMVRMPVSAAELARFCAARRAIFAMPRPAS